MQLSMLQGAFRDCNMPRSLWIWRCVAVCCELVWLRVVCELVVSRALSFHIDGFIETKYVLFVWNIDFNQIVFFMCQLTSQWSKKLIFIPSNTVKKKNHFNTNCLQTHTKWINLFMTSCSFCYFTKCWSYYLFFKLKNHNAGL